MKRQGSWIIHSVNDERWNNSGDCVWDTLSYAPGAQAWLDECKAKYGEVPDDTTYSFYKD